MALIKSIVFLKKWEGLSYEDNTLKLVNPIGAVVNDDTMESFEGFGPDIDSISAFSKTEDQKIAESWPVDGVSNDLQARWNTVLGIQSGQTLIIFDKKMYDSYPPNTGDIYQAAVNSGVKVNTKDDLFH